MFSSAEAIVIFLDLGAAIPCCEEIWYAGLNFQVPLKGQYLYQHTLYKVFLRVVSYPIILSTTYFKMLSFIELFAVLSWKMVSFKESSCFQLTSLCRNMENYLFCFHVRAPGQWEMTSHFHVGVYEQWRMNSRIQAGVVKQWGMNSRLHGRNFEQ